MDRNLRRMPLEGSGIPREQAETHVNIMSDFMEDVVAAKDLVTKQDINNLENRLISRMDARFSSLETEFKVTVEKLEHKILQSEYKAVVRFGSIVTVVVTLATVLGKLF